MSGKNCQIKIIKMQTFEQDTVRINEAWQCKKVVYTVMQS